MKIVSYIVMITFMFSCATDNAQTVVESTQQKCTRPSIATKSPASWLQEDEDRIPIFIAGCKRHYGKYHCPSKVLKTKTLSYQVTCKRENNVR